MKFPYFPEQASIFAGQIDTLYVVLVLLTLLFAIPIPLVILYFIVKYHRSTNADRSRQVNTDVRIETLWAVGPLILALMVFFWSAQIYNNVYGSPAPAGALDIYVIGKQWMWMVQHPEGKRENDELHVPVGVPVRLIMTSQDVIHSFYIPAFRIKRDVLPGRYTSYWFQADRVGEYHLFCAEYCGTEHSAMIGRVVVMELQDYQQWLTMNDGDFIVESVAPDTSGQNPPEGVIAPNPAEPLAQQGARIYARLGCVTCHVSNGSGPAPSNVGLYGSEVRLQNGEIVLADENYIRTAILNPRAQIVAGYEPIMPTYAGQLSEEELVQLIAYLKSLLGATDQ